MRIFHIVGWAIGLLASAIAAPAPEAVNNTLGLEFIAILPALSTTSITGFVIIASSANGTGVEVQVNITGLPTFEGAIYYHVSEFPAIPQTSCITTGGHLDPYNIGDLSGKHGAMLGPNFSETYYDAYLSTVNGSLAFVGDKSLVLHYSNGSELACANFKIPSASETVAYGPGPVVFGSTVSGLGNSATNPPVSSASASQVGGQGQSSAPATANGNILTVFQTVTVGDRVSVITSIFPAGTSIVSTGPLTMTQAFTNANSIISSAFSGAGGTSSVVGLTTASTGQPGDPGVVAGFTPGVIAGVTPGIVVSSLPLGTSSVTALQFNSQATGSPVSQTTSVLPSSPIDGATGSRPIQSQALTLSPTSAAVVLSQALTGDPVSNTAASGAFITDTMPASNGGSQSTDLVSTNTRPTPSSGSQTLLVPLGMSTTLGLTSDQAQTSMIISASPASISVTGQSPATPILLSAPVQSPSGMTLTGVYQSNVPITGGISGMSVLLSATMQFSDLPGGSLLTSSVPPTTVTTTSCDSSAPVTNIATVTLTRNCDCSSTFHETFLPSGPSAAPGTVTVYINVPTIPGGNLQPTVPFTSSSTAIMPSPGSSIITTTVTQPATPLPTTIGAPGSTITTTITVSSAVAPTSPTEPVTVTVTSTRSPVTTVIPLVTTVDVVTTIRSVETLSQTITTTIRSTAASQQAETVTVTTTEQGYTTYSVSTGLLSTAVTSLLDATRTVTISSVQPTTVTYTVTLSPSVWTYTSTSSQQGFIDSVTSRLFGGASTSSLTASASKTSLGLVESLTHEILPITTILPLTVNLPVTSLVSQVLGGVAPVTTLLPLTTLLQITTILPALPPLLPTGNTAVCQAGLCVSLGVLGTSTQCPGGICASVGVNSLLGLPVAATVTANVLNGILARDVKARATDMAAALVQTKPLGHMISRQAAYGPSTVTTTVIVDPPATGESTAQDTASAAVSVTPLQPPPNSTDITNDSKSAPESATIALVVGLSWLIVFML